MYHFKNCKIHIHERLLHFVYDLAFSMIFTTGPKTSNPSVLKKQARALVKNWPSKLLNLIEI
jgi:hypothetical protein